MTKSKAKNKKHSIPAQVKQNSSKEWLWFALLLLTVFIVHFPSLRNGFTNWDDPMYIIKNEFIKGFQSEHLKAIFCDFHNGHYHPLTWLSLMTDYSIFKLNPFGFHLINILFHLLNVSFVYIVIKKLFGKWQMALVTALLFGISPLSVESVAWVTERKNLLFAFFFLASIYSYLRYLDQKKMLWYFFAIFLFVLSVLSKSMAITLPVVLILMDYFRERKLFSKNAILDKIPFILISLIFGIVSIYAQSGIADVSINSIPLDNKLIYGAWGFFRYFIISVFPYKLSAFYPYIMNDFPVYYFAGWLFVVIFIWALWKLHKRNNRAIVFGLLFFLVNVFLLLKFFNIPYGSFYMADRYTYISSIGIYLVIAYLIFGSKKSVVKTSSAGIGLLVVLLVYYATYTYNRSKIWENSLSLWNDVIEKYPNANVPLLNRGNALRDEARFNDALQDYNQIISNDSLYFEALVNRGFVYDRLENYPEAIKDYNAALRIRPNDRNTIYNRALCYQKTGQNKPASDDIANMIKKGDESAEAFNTLGNVKFSEKKLDEAIDCYSKAIDKDPKNALYWYNRANSKAMLKKHKDACIDFDKAISLDNSNSDYFFNRGTTKYFLRDNNAALKDMKSAIKLNPKNKTYYLNKSTIELTMNNFDAAIKDVSSAISLDINNAENYARRAMIYFQYNKKGLGCKDANTSFRLGYMPAREILNKYCK